MSLTSLATLEFWPPPAVRKLAAHWVDTAVQVLAVARTDEGLAALCAQTELSRAEILRLIEQTKLSLSPEDNAVLGAEVNTKDMGLGARRPEGRSPPKT